jgi:hypothetical protein
MSVASFVTALAYFCEQLNLTVVAVVVGCVKLVRIRSLAEDTGSVESCI